MIRRLLATALFAAALAHGAPALAREGETVVFAAPAVETERLAIHAATDVAAMAPLIRDFQTRDPGVTVDYVEYVSNDLQAAAISACAAGKAPGDLLISPSVDQLLKLANDGCALAHLSPETETVPDWANWRNEVFGFSIEPAVFVYNARVVPEAEAPHTHVELADLLRRQIDRYAGRVGTYDIRVSGIGYLFAFNDARQTTTIFGRLLENLGRAAVVVRCCTSDVVAEVAAGRLLIGYNMLGSYAYAAARADPALRVVVPADYALVLARGALIPTHGASPDLARRFLDYLLSARGQQVVRDEAFFFSEDGPMPAGVAGPRALDEGGIARPIRIGPALLAVQDAAQRRRFIRDWSRSMVDMGVPPAP
ncbi:ABC transporter substrate-binding protein [Tistrella bauzanensis]|uniref:ABC transporter substrate-binding protein n=1 Tax=Tistrella arctica TaxID=3133430 RepID=A0ABU9YFD1_9PROT